MPIHLVREVVAGKIVPDSEGNQCSGMVQKRINLPEGKKFRVLDITVFDDNMGIQGNTEGTATSREIYITPYPIVPTDNVFGQNNFVRDASTVTGSGPYAGDDGVLYKRLEWSIEDFNELPNKDLVSNIHEFPNPQISIDNPFEWYTPHMYVTVKQNWKSNARLTPIAISVYVKLEIVKADNVQSTMGKMKEFLEAQCRLLTDTANSIDPTSSAAGRVFPSWKFGGTRSEIMINSSTLLKYYNNLNSNDYQGMQNTGSFRTRFKQATTMNAFDKPFGDSATDIPSWITLMNVAGVTSGPIRPFPPPTKFSGNGNTVMYDNAGIPASIVT